ncbi:hypothetical protein EDD63_10166 [Breznakia blatticola]|uniref:YcxB-like protein n=2 Tax=Erysipelotrichaceae TaxID=128827 RepID=A0A4R8A9H0_9FIRM|nr:hypothetical protein [Breznakia sp. PH1-1]MDH6403002.1 hypothetical protein [Breznakia sp. PF1-11]MDH6410711.1 hypothetical protein [Breznakia sp. PFB1-11]MDH6413232.1 hypothetical protein [Breznakia sp. PFB1-14]MDH6415600.1 hypothetical protein [Breznakia sp. PFB1-4]MDH6417899.1 hypothetical protein [Breznakia sp. PFB1-12]MDH6472882.1 hypothetical protein [Breznakia sp. PFB2-30]MDH6475340.1 hypothetical protein [Breznakia sp. PFB1-19]TDW26351.1 hypothetical protein EDD63_10166 [Breznaki
MNHIFTFDTPMSFDDVLDYANKHIDTYVYVRMYRLVNIIIAVLTMICVLLFAQLYYATTLTYTISSLIFGSILLIVDIFLIGFQKRTWAYRDNEHAYLQVQKEWKASLGKNLDAIAKLDKGKLYVNDKAYPKLVRVVIAKQFVLLQSKHRQVIVKLDEDKHDALIAYLQQHAPDVRIEVKNYIQDIVSKRIIAPM